MSMVTLSPALHRMFGPENKIEHCSYVLLIAIYTGLSADVPYSWQPVLTAISCVIYAFNRASNLQPYLTGLLLMIEGASTRIFEFLSNAGLSVSRQTVDRAKESLSKDALQHAITLAKSPSQAWILVFDNINLYLRKHHSQRLDHFNDMIHATNAALIQLPPSVEETVFDIQQWLKLQTKRSEFELSKLRPTEDEDNFMATCFDAIIAQAIVDNCPGRKKWSNFKETRHSVYANLPKDRPLSPEKTVATPIGALDVNEGSKAGCVEVIAAVRERLGFTEEEMASKMRLVAGDLLTVRFLRAARAQRQDEADPFDRLAFIHPVAQLFHYEMNAGLMLMKTHAINCVNDAGSLARQKDHLHRIFDINKPSYADAKALISHSLIARILDCLM
jgi:hypothetical protein